MYDIQFVIVLLNAVVIGTKLALENPSSGSTFLTQPINVTVDLHDEYHAFIMTNNTLNSTFILIEFGSRDSEHGRPLSIIQDPNLNFTYQIDAYEKCGIHVTLLIITFDERTRAEFLARSSSADISDNGHPVIRVRFTYYNSMISNTYSSNISYIEMTGSHPTSITPTSTLTTSPNPTSTISSPVPVPTKIPSSTTVTSIDFYVITMALSSSIYLIYLLSVL